MTDNQETANQEPTAEETNVIPVDFKFTAINGNSRPKDFSIDSAKTKNEDIKKKLEEERKKKNNDVLRSYRIK
jgi:hypothetical protein